MNAYQKEQLDAFVLVVDFLETLADIDKSQLKTKVHDYLAFRNQVDDFLGRHFSRVCTAKCFRSHLSACCSKDGIITFFADVVINVLFSTRTELDLLLKAIQTEQPSVKCIYLGEKGCFWRIKPIICEMFLCDSAKKIIFETDASAKIEWTRLKAAAKRFRWPDQPVLFDWIEDLFIAKGYSSPLMYLHNSPGLLHIKQKARQLK
jgi:hypothetical protein